MHHHHWHHVKFQIQFPPCCSVKIGHQVLDCTKGKALFQYIQAQRVRHFNLDDGIMVFCSMVEVLVSAVVVVRGHYITSQQKGNHRIEQE